MIRTFFQCLGASLVSGALWTATAFVWVSAIDNAPAAYRAPAVHVGYVGPSRNHVDRPKAWTPTLPYVEVHAPSSAAALAMAGGGVHTEQAGFGPHAWRVFRTADAYQLYHRQNALWADGTTR